MSSTTAATDRVLGEAIPAPVTDRQRAAQALADRVETADLPIIDLEKFMGQEDSAEAKAECEKVAQALHRFGCLIVRDPRVSTADNDKFVDVMEEYFERPEEAKLKDTRPDLHFQVGATPHHVEKPRNQCSRMAELDGDHKPLSLCPPELDPKWRFFWRIGERPGEGETRFPALNATPVLPEGMPVFPETMDMWGGKMIAALRQIADMAGRGFGVEQGVLPAMMDKAPHLLAPTGSNFYKYGELGTVLAGYHYDLNFMTIHGRSRFPGLYIWLRDGTRMAVKVPEHCLLVQAGKQFEYLSGGHVLAGFHEVVVSPGTVAAIDRRRAEGKSLWRVSSTLFGHIASDVRLKPLAPFVELIKQATPEGGRAEVEARLARDYPEVNTGDQVEAELKAINLKESQAAQ